MIEIKSSRIGKVTEFEVKFSRIGKGMEFEIKDWKICGI